MLIGPGADVPPPESLSFVESDTAGPPFGESAVSIFADRKDRRFRKSSGNANNLIAMDKANKLTILCPFIFYLNFIKILNFDDTLLSHYLLRLSRKSPSRCCASLSSASESFRILP